MDDSGRNRDDAGPPRDTGPPKPGGDPSDAEAATVCPLCAVGCHLREGEGSRAAGVAGPSNPEGRLCRKGVTAFERVAGEGRLTVPAVADSDGEQVPTDWDSALDAAVEGFQRVLDADGPEALAFLGAPHCTTEENYLLGKLARLLGTNDVDNRSRLCHDGTARALSTRLGYPATTNGLADLPGADVIVVVGANPAERQPVAFDSFVRPAVNDGTTLVHVDPVGNRTTRLADVHLAPRPGMDALVLDLLSAMVVDRGGVDSEFVAERTRGFEDLATGLADLDSGEAAAVAGVDPDALADVADRVTAADRTAAMTGTGIEGDGTASAPDALLNLLLLTGNVGRSGTGLFVLRGLVNEQGATDAGCVPDRLPGHQDVTDAAARERVADVWGVEPPADPGKDANELLSAFGDEIRAALVVGENPAVSKFDPDWIDDRLGGLDHLVVLDVAESETTPYADVVLPAAAGLEKTGTVTNLDRTVQRLRRVREPPGEAVPDFEILRALGQRLVGPGGFDYDGPGAAFDELTRVAPTYAGRSYADLAGRPARWPFDEDAVLYRESFETADGRAPFVGPQPVVDTGGEGLRLVTGGRASDDDDRDATERVVRMHPADADARGIENGDSVVVSNGGVVVEGTAEVGGSVRAGTVYAHASVADPLLRGDGSTVSVKRLRASLAGSE